MENLFQLDTLEIEKLETLLSTSNIVDEMSLPPINNMDCSQSPCKNTCETHCDGTCYGGKK